MCNFYGLCFDKRGLPSSCSLPPLSFAMQMGYKPFRAMSISNHTRNTLATQQERAHPGSWHHCWSYRLRNTETSRRSFNIPAWTFKWDKNIVFLFKSLWYLSFSYSTKSLLLSKLFPISMHVVCPLLSQILFFWC